VRDVNYEENGFISSIIQIRGKRVNVLIQIRSLFSGKNITRYFSVKINQRFEGI
jgi:hypothetical protein